MKKHLFAAAMALSLGLAVGCGAAGASGDVTVTTVEQEEATVSQEDMVIPQVYSTQVETAAEEADDPEAVTGAEETATMLEENLTETEAVGE